MVLNFNFKFEILQLRDTVAHLTCKVMLSSKCESSVKSKHPHVIEKGDVAMTKNQVAYREFREQERHNLESEAQNRENLRIADFNAQENRRHNTVNEQLEFSRNAETQRHNQVQEQLSAEGNAIAWENAQSQRISAGANAQNASTNALNGEISRALTQTNIDSNKLSYQVNSKVLPATAAETIANSNSAASVLGTGLGSMLAKGLNDILHVGGSLADTAYKALRGTSYIKQD